MMRGRRISTLLVTAVLASALLVSQARAAEPVRSGTILVAARGTTPLGPIWGCWGAPDCLVWLQTCTAPHSQEPGVMASIVDVQDLAGSSRTRTFRIVDRMSDALADDVTVEFFTDTCSQLPGGFVGSWSEFVIPYRAAWMTVTAGCSPWLCESFSGVGLKWELR